MQKKANRKNLQLRLDQRTHYAEAVQAIVKPSRPETQYFAMCHEQYFEEVDLS